MTWIVNILFVPIMFTVRGSAAYKQSSRFYTQTIAQNNNNNNNKITIAHAIHLPNNNNNN